MYEILNTSHANGEKVHARMLKREAEVARVLSEATEAVNGMAECLQSFGGFNGNLPTWRAQASGAQGLT